jgi:hypothetical protein
MLRPLGKLICFYRRERGSARMAYLSFQTPSKASTWARRHRIHASLSESSYRFVQAAQFLG